ncbi:hypothetical protein EBU95_07565 [bacterium]|nr:hypothetical protein [bacterium]
MIFSGSNFFRFPNQKSLSFNLNLKILNAYANSSFGFSGDSQGLAFNIKDNIIYDFNNFLVYSAYSGEGISISGDINQTGYSYYINSKPIYLNQNKNNFEINKFFYSIENNFIISGSIDIFGERPNYSIYFPDIFLSGEAISGRIINESLDKSFKFIDISGSYYNKLLSEIPIKNSLIFLSKNTGTLNPGETGNFTIKTSGVNFKTLNNVFDLSIYTDFGNIDEEYNSAVALGEEDIFNFYYYSLPLNLNSNKNIYTSNLSARQQGILNYTSYKKKNNLYTNYNRPLEISLTYDSGTTGEITAKIPGSGFTNIMYTGYINGSGYLSASSASGIATGRNLISNEIKTGLVYQSFAKNTLDFLSGNIDQYVQLIVSGYSSGEFLAVERFPATGNEVSLLFTNNNVSGLDYISGTIYNFNVSGNYNNSIYSGKIAEASFITGAYFTGVFNKDLSDVIGSGVLTGYSNSIFTGISYVNNMGSGHIIGSGFLTGTNTNIIVTGKMSGDLNDTIRVKSINKTIYGFKIATGIRNLTLELTGYGLSTGDYKGTNLFGNFISGTGLNSFNASGYIIGTGFLTGNGIGYLYDKYGSSGTGFYTGFKYYDSANEKIYISNAGFNNVNSIYTKNNAYNYSSGNLAIRWSLNSGWVILSNNIPIYGSNSNTETPVEATGWFSYPGYSQVPHVSGNPKDYIDFNYNINATGLGIVTGLNNNLIDIFSNNFIKSYTLNLTGSGEYYFSEIDSVSGTGLIELFNNFSSTIISYPITGVISGSSVTSGIEYYTGISSGDYNLFISGTGTLSSTLGLPILTPVTGIYSSGYVEIFNVNNSGTKKLDLNSSIATGILAKDYSAVGIPPNIYLAGWQNDSSSFTNTNSPNGQYIYVNQLNPFVTNIFDSGYIGDYHYIIYNATSGWQMRRRNSNSYGWSGLKTPNNIPLNGWTGIGLSSTRQPGTISKIGFSHLNLRSVDPAYYNRSGWSFNQAFANINTGITLTGSGLFNFSKTVNYSGKLISGVGLFPIIGNITGLGKVYVTGYNKNISLLTGGFLQNKISTIDGSIYNNSDIIGVGLLQANIIKTGYYEDTAILAPTTGYIYSQVEFPYSGIIDTYSGYLNNSSNRLLSNINFTINNSSGFIQTGINLRQDKAMLQDNSGRIANLLPLQLYPITDYSGFNEYLIYATGFFTEDITGYFNVEDTVYESGRFLATGNLSGILDLDYTSQNSGIRFISQTVTGILNQPKILGTDSNIYSSGLGTGFVDKAIVSTGYVSRLLTLKPIVTIMEGMTLTGSGFMTKSLVRNLTMNVQSGIAYYSNPYIENIDNYNLTGHITPFIASGNKTTIENELITGLIDSAYIKSFGNSFYIRTGYISGTTRTGIRDLNLFNPTGYRVTFNIPQNISGIFIEIDKLNHYTDNLIYSKLRLSGQNKDGVTSVIYENITGGL